MKLGHMEAGVFWLLGLLAAVAIAQVPAASRPIDIPAICPAAFWFATSPAILCIAMCWWRTDRALWRSVP